MDDLMALVLRDLKQKFDEDIERRFEQNLSWSADYPEMEINENEHLR
jgi:hypothetical protein